MKRIWYFIRRKKYITPPAPVLPPAPREFLLPAEKVEGFLKLYDTWLKAGNGDKVAKYNMWSYLGECFPVINEKGSLHWNFKMVTINHIVIVENLNK